LIKILGELEPRHVQRHVVTDTRWLDNNVVCITNRFVRENELVEIWVFGRGTRWISQIIVLNEQIIVVEEHLNDVSFLPQRSILIPLNWLWYDGNDLRTKVQLKIKREIFSIIQAVRGKIGEREAIRVSQSIRTGSIDHDPIKVIRQRFRETHDDFVIVWCRIHTNETRRHHYLIAIVKRAIRSALYDTDPAKRGRVDDLLVIKAKSKSAWGNIANLTGSYDLASVRLDSAQLRANGQQIPRFQLLQQ
jgi:hypothetical protein